MLTTTKQLLRKFHACESRYAHLVKFLGPIADNDPIPLTRICELNGLEDALWALVAVPKDQRLERDRLARRFACRCVRETPIANGQTVWDLLTDERSRNALVVTELFVAGRATKKELRDAVTAACDVYDLTTYPAARAAVCAAAEIGTDYLGAGVANAAARAGYYSALEATGDAADALNTARSAQTKIFLEEFKDSACSRKSTGMMKGKRNP